MSRRLAVEQRMYAAGGAYPGFTVLNLLNYTKIENAHEVPSLGKKSFIYCYVAVICTQARKQRGKPGNCRHDHFGTPKNISWLQLNMYNCWGQNRYGQKQESHRPCLRKSCFRIDFVFMTSTLFALFTQRMKKIFARGTQNFSSIGTALDAGGPRPFSLKRVIDFYSRFEKCIRSLICSTVNGFVMGEPVERARKQIAFSCVERNSPEVAKPTPCMNRVS